MPSASFAVFEEHIGSRGHVLNHRDRETIRSQFKPVSAKRGEVILDSARIAGDLFFVAEGVVASIQNSLDGDTQIARFFECGQFCSNVTSAWQNTVSEDELVAMTDFSGLRIPFESFRASFLHGGHLDTFWREAMFETLLFDKDILCTKTIRDVGTRYRFLAERYDSVVAQVPNRHLARFLGITPQGLSRFLRNSRAELT